MSTTHDAQPHDPLPDPSHPFDDAAPALAIGALMAPVVACLRGDDDGVRILFEGACEDGTSQAALRAAPGVARVYLRLAPPPDGADRILAGYIGGALDRFGDREVVAIGAECLEVARVEPAIAPVAECGVRRRRARARGRWRALVGAVASLLVVRRARRRAAGDRSGRGDRGDLPLPVGRRLSAASRPSTARLLDRRASPVMSRWMLQWNA